MASKVLKRPITVYQVDNGGISELITYGEDYKGAAVCVLWSGNHYDVLLKQQDPQSKL